MKRRRHGTANVEFLLYMTLLLILGLLVFSLAAAGSSAYSKLSDRKDRDGQLRVAVSYLEVELRKHDAQGAIRLGTNPFGSGEAVFLTDEFGGESYEKVVFCQNGSLYELMTLQGAERTLEMASAVSSVERVSVVLEGSGLRIRAWTKDGSQLDTFLLLRSSEAMVTS